MINNIKNDLFYKVIINYKNSWKKKIEGAPNEYKKRKAEDIYHVVSDLVDVYRLYYKNILSKELQESKKKKFVIYKPVV